MTTKIKQIKKPYKRVLEISEDAKQITLPDSRYYRRNDKYYPSVTYVLNYYPKGKHFEEWLKKVGYSADYLMQKAGDDGTKVHEMIENYLNGEEINFLDKNEDPQYDVDVWKMFLRFVEWWEEYKPTLLETEVHLFSDELEIAGTCDLICEIDKEIWVIDFKTSNSLYLTYDLQTAVYGKCFEDCFERKPDRHGILWLKSTKRGPAKNKIQGKGWELHESSRSQEENLEIFKAVRKLFDLENPNHKPAFVEFRTSAKREL